MISFRLVSKISAKRKSYNGNFGADVSLENLRDPNGLFWIVPSEVAIQWQPSKEGF